jgi:rod shape-determining protein MreC
VALATLDRRPPSLFRQGPTALSKLLLCAAAAIALMVADTRFALTPPLRSALASLLSPVQRLLLAPISSWENLTDRLRGAESAMRAEEAARQQLAQQALVLARTQTLQRENEALRQLLALRAAQAPRTLAAEVLYAQRDLYSQRVVIDRGRLDGLHSGSPVIDERGVLGQLQRVHARSAEVTLLTDREASLTVVNERSGAMLLAYGGARPWGMELRYVTASSDVQVGDVLRTSGLDGVFPPGLPVARVAQVEKRGQTSFSKIGVQPFAVADRAKQVLVILPSPAVEQAKQEAAP